MDLFADIKSCVTVNVIEIEQICAPVCSAAIPHCLIELLSHVLLVTTPVDNNLTIDLIVDLDYYWSIVLPGVMSLGPGLVALETVFGWLISGYAGATATDGQRGNPSVGYQFLCHLRFPNAIINDNLIESLWFGFT